MMTVMTDDDVTEVRRRCRHFPPVSDGGSGTFRCGLLA